MTDFIDLNRRFYKAADQNNPEALAQDSYLLSVLGDKGSLGWSEILQQHLVVILGEPGSGKSTELFHKMDELCDQSKYAFLLRLDRLVNESFLAVLGENKMTMFRKWKQGRGPAWFFFDSIDESKLRKPDDFLTVIDKISEAIGILELRRAFITFSSRISEWRPVTDTEALRRHFPFSDQPINQEMEPRRQKHDFSIGRENDSYMVDSQKKGEAVNNRPLIVLLAPLDRERIRRYAEGRGLSDPQAFLKAHIQGRSATKAEATSSGVL